MTFDAALFASTFGVVFLSELPDKTMLAAMVMAARRRPAAVFAGVTAAFVVQSLVAVLFGRVFAYLPAHWVRAGAGALFLFFAWRTWTEGEEEEAVEGAETRSAAGFARAAWASFLVIFLAEWGDLSQLATAALVAHTRKPLTVFLGATAALTTATALAVAVGRRMKGRVHPEKLKRGAALAFAAVGAYILVRG